MVPQIVATIYSKEHPQGRDVGRCDLDTLLQGDYTLVVDLSESRARSNVAKTTGWRKLTKTQARIFDMLMSHPKQEQRVVDSRVAADRTVRKTLAIVDPQQGPGRSTRRWFKAVSEIEYAFQPENLDYLLVVPV